MGEQSRLDLLLLRYEELRAQNAPASAEELCRDCPELVAELERQIQMIDSMNALLGSAASAEALTVTRTPTADASRSPQP